MTRQCSHCKTEVSPEAAECPRCDLSLQSAAHHEDVRTFTTWATVTALLTGFLMTVVGVVLIIVARVSEDAVMEARFRILLWLGAAMMLAAIAVLAVRHRKQK
jgi:membrane protein DedA with SNARE-associated domain